MSLAVLVEHVDHFQHRVIEDAFNEATSRYWRRRAETFSDARPRPGDYTGRATAGDLADRDRRLTETAKACRNRAHVALYGEELPSYDVELPS